MRNRTLWLAGVVVGVGVSVADAWRLRWVGDDAFVSFRYARNLVRGLGLVYNAGERVEGYTNFLWTLLVSGGMALGLDPVVFSEVAGIACFAALLVLLARTSLRAGAVPLAAIAYASLEHARSFATSGLETSSYVLLVTATLLGAIRADSVRGWAGVGLLGALTVLTRPDGALFYGLAGALALIDAARLRDPRFVAAVAAPGAALLLPWAAWKLAFYGSLLPNTFHAKSAAGAWWAQGSLYLRLYFTTYWPVALGGAALPLAAWLGRHEGGGPGWRGWRGPVFLGVGTALYLVYVARVGGDFMFARFCLPITPALLLGLERVAARIPRPSAAWGLALATAGALAFLRVYPEQLRNRVGKLDELGIQGIVEERDWYPDTYVALARTRGEQLRVLLEGTDARVLILGGQAMLAYYAEYPYTLEGAGGLTDPEIARLWVGDHARIGHKDNVTIEYLQGRDIDLWFMLLPPVPEYPYYSWSKIEVGQGLEGMIVSYRKPLLDLLRARGARFQDGGQVVDEYAALLPGQDDERVRITHETLRGWYFSHTPDPAREAPFLARLAAPTSP